MFERFSDRARRVMVLAQEEARMLDHDYIGTEHILLGLIREGDGVAAHVLRDSGVDLNRAREQVIEMLPSQGAEDVLPPSGPPASGDLVSQLASFAARLDVIEQRLRQSPAG
jgi:ATP-dependent Clp protease ATP-binding subunit ClpA